MQQSLEEGWQKAMESFAGGKSLHAFAGLGEATNAPPLVPQFTFAPDKLAALQQAYLKEAAELWNHGLQRATSRDKRFADEAWSANPVSAFSAAS
jgi:polyhydroxyalkanoate synthase